ncbi:hypothetical protein [Parachlamydia acanthamoebae]|uniref:Uncharacterized protein n=1 Tax=Parachlamydia acanthamoebae TaxID=83552 RepID=A0A0C1C9H1_9BACT|nr:hypothetical protein [Parachlamydia acanthamoebae]KIA77650.1 hypothetical protein DB43_GB00120 [Parachlamydia acanthamoebae]
MPPDLEDRLKRLEVGINLLKKINEQAMRESGITEETLLEMQNNPPPRHSKEGITLERAKKLRGVVQEIEQSYKIAYQIAKRREEIYGRKKGAKNIAKNRQKKFKRLGGDKDWVPL